MRAHIESRSNRLQLTTALLVILVVAPALPLPAAAYPDSVSAMTDGALNRTVILAYPPVARSAGSIAVLSNATVQSGYITLSGQPYTLPASYNHNGAVGFPSGTTTSLLSAAPSGLSLRLANGSVEFAGAALDSGAFSGTVHGPSGVVLTGPSGTYTSPSISWNGISYGRLVADAAPGFATWAITYDVVDANGSLLQAGLLPGQVITVDGSVQSSIRIRASLSSANVIDTPTLRRLGAGYVLADYNQGTIASRAFVYSTVYDGDKLSLRESLLNYTEYASNPLLGGAGGTWYSIGPLVGSSVSVGREIWHYFASADSGGGNHIGRMVSADGGATWTIDANAMLNQTAATWDSAYVGIPAVVNDGASGFKMWYMGASTIDQFKIGYATSSDGITWTKYASNPVLNTGSAAWENANVGWPVVTKVGSTFYMFYSGRNSGSALKSTGYATSTDGTSWTRYASNPILAHGSVTNGGYEAVASDVAYVGGTFYLYWTCSSSATAYDTCVATSNNAQTWTFPTNNPIFTHGDATWDSLTAELGGPIFDPVTGHQKLWVSGRPSTAVYGMGRADPNFETPGSYATNWNLSGEVPHTFLTHTLEASTGGGSSAAANLKVGATNTTYGSAEPLGASGTFIQTAPDTWLAYQVNLTATTDTRASAVVSSMRLAYERYGTSGTFVSAPTLEPYPIANATVTLSSSIPANSSLQLSVSNDNGATWFPAASGVPYNFSAPGLVFRYRLVFAGTSAVSPTVTNVAFSLGVDSLAQSVTIKGPTGALIASAPGTLNGATTVTLDPAYFNTRLAPVAASDPPYPVDFEMLVNASTAGVVKIDAVQLNFTVPDLLRAYFAPENATVTVDAGSAQSFRVAAATTAGVPITYAWRLDGVLSSQTGPVYTHTTLPSSVGSSTLSVSVSNGQFTINHTWTIQVVAPPVPLVAEFYPSVYDIEVPVGLLQQFFAAALPSVGSTVSWQLDGSAAGSLTGYDYTAPALPGLHVVTASVTNGLETVGWQWNVTVTAVPGAPSRQLVVQFDPPTNRTLAWGDTVKFFANFSGAAPAGVQFEWRLNGNTVGGNAGEFDFTAATADIGTNAVSVLVRNTTALTAHSWTVTVLAPPVLPPTISISGPANGTTVNTSSVTVSGHATAGSTVSVNGVSVTLSASGDWSTAVTVFVGSNRIVAVAADSFGQTGSASVTLTVVAATVPPPSIAITSPSTGTTTNASTATVSGHATPGSTVVVNGVAVTPDANGVWSTDVTLFFGSNHIVAIATDSAGRTSSAEVTVQQTAPEAPAITTQPPESGLSTILLLVVLALAAVAAVLAVMLMRARRQQPADTGNPTPPPRD